MSVIDRVKCPVVKSVHRTLFPAPF